MIDFETFEEAQIAAEDLTTRRRVLWIATDDGPGYLPRFRILEAPTVGDKVSYAFNGDYTPDGEITSISKTLKVITTSSGNRYYRRNESGSWIMGNTWSLVSGHISERNPHF